MDSSSVEDSLIAICRHSIKVNQCFGQIPVSMSIERSDERGLVVILRRKLTFKVISVPFLISLFFVLCWILSVVQSFYWMLSRDSRTKLAKLQGFEKTTTGSWSAYLTGCVLTTSVVLQRFYGLLFTKSHILKIWNEMVRKLGEISNSCPFGSFKISLEDSKYCDVFRKVSFHIRRTALVHLVVAAGHFLVASIMFIVRRLEFSRHSFPTLEDPSVIFFLVSHSWTWFILMHFAIFSWVTLPMELCQGCLNMISRELAEIRVFMQQQGNLRKNSEPVKDYSRNYYNHYHWPTVSMLQSVTPTEKDSKNDLTVERELYFEKSLDTCIDNYHRVKSLIHFYSEHFGMRLIFDIIACALLLLGNTFVMIILILHKTVQNANFSFLLSAMSLKVLHSLGSAAGDLTIECDKILDELCQLPLHQLNGELKEKARNN
jgi:hypothetical protein